MGRMKDVFAVVISLLITGLISLKAFPTLNTVLPDPYLTNALDLYLILCWVGVGLASVIGVVMLCLSNTAAVKAKASEFAAIFESPAQKFGMLLGWVNILLMSMVLMDWGYVIVLVLCQAASAGLYFTCKMKASK